MLIGSCVFASDAVISAHISDVSDNVVFGTFQTSLIWRFLVALVVNGGTGKNS